MMRILGLLLAIGGVYFCEGRAHADPPVVSPEIAITDAAVLESVARSLPFLERAGVAWMSERDCVSCHHVPFLLWSHRAAAARRIAVDSEKLSQWNDWARRDSLDRRNSFKLTAYELKKLDATALPDLVRDKLKPVFDQGFVSEEQFIARLREVLSADELQAHQEQLVKNAMLPTHSPERTGGGVDVLVNLLLGELPKADSVSTNEFQAGTLALMKEGQQASGAWVPGSQFASMRRWNTAAADQTTTMWTALALAEFARPTDLKQSAPVPTGSEPGRGPIERAIAYLKQQPEQPDNHEWLAVRLLFSSRFESPDQTRQWQQKLLATRGADGGWCWEKGNPADPYTTGLVLYALGKTGGASLEVVRDARRFLLSRQQPDGSWQTESRYITKTTDPARWKVRDEIYHYWGTGWVVLGLLETVSVTSPD